MKEKRTLFSHMIFPSLLSITIITIFSIHVFLPLSMVAAYIEPKDMDSSSISSHDNIFSIAGNNNNNNNNIFGSLF